MPEVTVLHLAALAPQALVAVTHTDDDPVKGVGKFTVIDGVFAPVAMVALAGTVQLYPVAPGTAAIEKGTPVEPGHAVETPVGTAGFTGFLLILIHLGALVEAPLHARAAVTQSCPETNPEGNVTDTFVGLLPPFGLIGAVAPFNVQV
jgi:hypothetical protein